MSTYNGLAAMPGIFRKACWRAVGGVILVMSLVSCRQQVAEGGMGGSGISQGPITGFGSVFVNGIEHFLTSATIVVNGDEAGDADLKLGMIVRVAGAVDSAAGTGDATEIEYEQNLEGPVDSIDPLTDRLIVLGQLVVLDGLTVFDDLVDQEIDGVFDGVVDLADLDVLVDATPGVYMVEISGLVDGNSVIHATRIEVEVDSGSYELTGTISSHNGASMMFDIIDQPIDYSAVLMLEVPGGVPVNGLFVRVEGTRPGGVGTPIRAVSVQADDLSPEAEIDEDLEVEGFISNFVSSSQFLVSGQPVRTSAQTQYEHGVISDLANDVHIEAEGSVASDGVLDANEISFKGKTSLRGELGEYEIYANIEAVYESVGTITVFGESIVINASTQLEDERDELVFFDITDLAVTDRIDLKVFRDTSNGELIAESLHRKDTPVDANGQSDPSLVSLEGPADAVDVGLKEVVVLGVLITTSPETDYPGSDAGAFFTAAAQLADASIEAKGTLVGVGATILASELKLDD